jgi:hypothetical protein
VAEVAKKALEQVACNSSQLDVPSQLQSAFWRGTLPGAREKFICGLPTEGQVRVLSGAAVEFDSSPVDRHGPNEIPVLENPQGCKAGLTDVLAQLPVTSGKNKGALYDATGGALGGRQEGFVSAIVAVCYAFRYIAPPWKKLENRN